MLKRNWPSVEAARGAGGDRVAEQHRVGEAVDGDRAAGGEGAQGAAEDRADQVGVADSQLGLLGGGRRAGLLTVLPRLLATSPQRQVHADLGAAVDAALDLEAAGEGGDQGQADPQAGPVDVGARPDPHPEVADDDGEALLAGDRLDLEQTRLIGGVGVDDDVHAGLGDDRLQVGDARFVHPDPLRQAGEGVADDSDVLRSGG